MDSKIALKEHTYFDIKKVINQIAAEYPFISLKTIARSAAGREIYGFKISEADEYVLYLAPFCGKDRLTSLILLKFTEEFCHAIHTGDYMAGLDLRRAIFGRGVIIIPLINPDGYEISLRGLAGCGHLGPTISKLCRGNFSEWEANLRGVDLERNFFKGTGGAPCKEGFAGYSPLSEPESLNLAELCRKTKIRHVINLCSDGSGISYADKSGRCHKMAEIMAAVTGYTINVDTEPKKDFKTWFSEEFVRPAFRIGTERLDTDNINTVYEHVKELLTLSALM